LSSFQIVEGSLKGAGKSTQAQDSSTNSLSQYEQSAHANTQPDEEKMAAWGPVEVQRSEGTRFGGKSKGRLTTKEHQHQNQKQRQKSKGDQKQNNEQDNQDQTTQTKNQSTTNE